MKDVDVARFSRWAESYDRSLLQRLIFEPVHGVLLQRIAELSPKPTSLLDIGCGTGRLLRRAAAVFPEARLTGVDPAEEMVEAARAAAPKGSKISVVPGFAEELPFPAGSFDIATTTMSFHHWEDQPRAIREVRRVLSPGGLFFLTDIFPRRFLHWLFARSNHGHFIGPERLARLLEAAGFEPPRFVPLRRFGRRIQVVIARAGT